MKLSWIPAPIIYLYLFQPYRGGNQDSSEERDRNVPTVTFELDSSPPGSQNTAATENQSEQNMAQSKPPGVRGLFTLLKSFETFDVLLNFPCSYKNIRLCMII